MPGLAYLALYCGALLGIANALDVAQVYPDPQHFTAYTGASTFTWRTNGGAISPNDRIAATASLSTHNPAQRTCGTDIVASGAWFVMTPEFKAGLAIAKEQVAATPFGGTAGGAAATLSTLTRGKYRLCYCTGGATACSNDVGATGAVGNGLFTLAIGYLHVIDSVPYAGAQAETIALGPLAPMVFLQSNGGSSAVTVKASWLFSSAHTAGDAFMINNVTADLSTGSRLNQWAFQCGQTKLNGGSAIDIIALLGPSTVTTSTAMGGCSNTVDNTKTLGDSIEYSSTGCATNQRRETAAFVPPTVATSASNLGYLCYCRFEFEGSCASRSNFGVALGPISFRQFVAGNPTQHHTIHWSAATSKVQVTADGTNSFSTSDRVGLVRLDEPADVASASSNVGTYNYNGQSASRTCGWSNLDIPMDVSAPLVPAPTTTSTFTYAVTGTNVAEVTFGGINQFNLARKYRMCLCDSDSVELAVDNTLTTPACPQPSHLGNSAQDVSNNAAWHWQSTYYAQSLGYLHVVTSLNYPVNVLVQAGARFHLTVNFRSASVDTSTYSQAAANTGYDKFTGRRFFMIDSTSTCGVNGPTSAFTTVVDKAQFVRLHATGVHDNKNIAEDNTAGLTPATTAKWGSMWSLTTGWAADPLKTATAIPAGTNQASAQANVGVAGADALVFMDVSNAGKSFKICYCDPMTEFPGTSFNDGTGVDSCVAAFTAQDYSYFAVELGAITVQKFTFQSPSSTQIPHYTVQKSATATLTLDIPAASVSNTGTVRTANDKVGFIPFYGDGYGVDSVPGYNVGGAIEYADVKTNGRPWKTELFCGHQALGTVHNYYIDGAWKTLGDITSRPTALASSDASTVTTSPVDTSIWAGRKLKVCYCSFDSYSSACPSNSAAIIDTGSDVSGYGSAHRFSDYAGMLHVVDTVSLPVSTIAEASAAAVGNAYTMTWVVIDATNDKVIYIDSAQASKCGYTAQSATVTVADSTPTQVGATTSYTFGAVSTSANLERLRICFCSYNDEALAEALPAVASCTVTSTAEFGVELGRITLGKFVTAIAPHFTVTTQTALQDFTITLDYDVAGTGSTLTPANNVAAPAAADQVGFLKDPVKVCGTDALASQADMTSVSRIVESSIAMTKLVTSGYNFSANSFVAHVNYPACYCQVDFLEASNCSATTQTHWYNLGVLHVVDMAIWPQEFVLATAYDGGDNRPSIVVQFKDVKTKSWNSLDKFAIVGIQYNSALSTADPKLKQTRACGYLWGSEGQVAAQSVLTAADYKVSEGTMDTTITGKDTWLKVLWKADTRTASTALKPTPSLVKYEWHGTSNGKTVCMCDSVAQTNNACNFNTVPTVAAQLSEFVDSFGITVGQVWGAKTITVANRNELIRQHFSVKKAASQQFTVMGLNTVVTPSDQQASPQSSDYVSLLSSADGNVCGYSAVGSVYPVTANNAEARLTVDASQMTFTGTSTKYQLCYCRSAVFSSCSTSSAYHFPELVGFLHVMDMPTLPIFFVANTGTATSISVKFNQKPELADRLAVILDWTDNNPIAYSNYKCGETDVLIDAATNNAVATELGTNWAIDTTPDWNRYEVMAVTGSVFLSSQSVVVDDQTNTLTSAQATIGAGHWQFRVCYCSSAAEGTCSSAQPITDRLSYYADYGADLGTLKVAAFLTEADNGQQFTIWKDSTNQISANILKITPTATLALGANDKWAVILPTQQCGATEITLASGSLTNAVGVTLVQTYSGCGGTAGVAAGKCPKFMTTGAISTGSLPNALYKVCLCSAASSLNGLTCQTSTASDWSDDAGKLHVLQGDMDYQHFSVNLLEESTFTIQFGAAQSLSTNDKLMLIPEAGNCGDSSEAAGVAVLSKSTVTYTTGTNNMGQTLSPSLVTQSTPGVFKVCMCSAANQDTGTCTPTSTAGAQSQYGIDVGLLIVNNIKVAQYDKIWTGSVSAATGQNVALHYPAGSSILADGGSVCFVESSASCFTATNSFVCTAASTASRSAFSTLITSGTSVAFDFSSATASRRLYRLCVNTNGAVAKRDVSSMGVYVSDVTLFPTTAKRTSASAIQFTYVNSMMAGQDHVWFQRATLACSYPTAAGASSTNARVALASSVKDVFDFSAVTPLADDFRLCVGFSCTPATGQCTSIYDYYDTSVVVYDSLTNTPSSVPFGATADVTFDYTGALTSTDKVWFQRTTNPSPRTPLACSTAAPVVASTTNTEELQPVSSSAISFDFSQVSANLASQDQFRLCVKSNTGDIKDYSPIGIYVINVVISPTAVGIAQESITVTYDYNSVTNTATGGRSLVEQDVMWFQLDTEACDSSPPHAGAHTSDSKTVAATGTSYNFDFSKVNFTGVDKHSKLRLCVLATAHPELTRDYSSIGVQVVSVTIVGSRSVRKESRQAVTLTFTDSLAVGGSIWFKKADVACGVAVATADSSDIVSVAASGTPMDFDFSGTTLSQKQYRLCYRPPGSSAASLGLDYSSVSVFLTDLKASPSSVLSAHSQTVVFTFDSTALVANDYVQFVSSTIACPTALNQPITSQTSSTHRISGPGTEKSQIIPKGAIGVVKNLQSCPWQTGADRWAFSPRFCDYRCDAINTNCWIQDFDFSSSSVTVDPYRVCVQASQESDAILDYDVVQVYVVDVAVRPTSMSMSSSGNVDFTNNAGTGAASANSLPNSDAVWFQATGVDCQEAAPTMSGATYTTSQVYTGASMMVDFTSILSASELRVCAQTASKPTRDYSSVGIYIVDVTVSPTSIQNGQATATLTLTYGATKTGSLFQCAGVGCQLTLDGTATGIVPKSDTLYFLAATQACTVSTAATTTSSPTSSNHVALTSVSPAATVFNFSTVLPSDETYRLCVTRHPDIEVTSLDYSLDYASVSLTVTDAALTVHSVRASSNQVVGLTQTSGVSKGDSVFFLRSTSACSSVNNGLAPASGAAGPDYSNTITLTSEVTSTLQLILDFSQANPVDRTAWRMCVASPKTTGTTTYTVMRDLDGFNTRLFLVDVVLDVSLVRAAAGQQIQFSYVQSIDATDDACFTSSEETCACAVAGTSTRTAKVGVNAAPASPFAATQTTQTFDFSAVRVSNSKMMRLCVLDGGVTSLDYSGLGVYVTDLTIAGSLATGSATVGCVSASTKQSVAFSSLTPFDFSDVLFFRLTKDALAPLSCGPAPTAASATSSNAVAMSNIASNGLTAVTWTMEFDFTGAAPSKEPYRLCVDVGGNGITFLDYAPLGVRVNGITIPGNSVKPLTLQPVTFFYAVTGSNQFKGGDEVWFVSTVDSTDCACVKAGTCSTTAMYTDIQPVGSSGSVVTFDFSKFNSATAPDGHAAKLCSNDGAQTYELACVTVGFEVTVNPASAPANAGQVLALTYPGATLVAGDEVMWRLDYSGGACPTTGFAAARAASPDVYSSVATVGASGASLVFNLTGISGSSDMKLCINSTSHAPNGVFEVSKTTLRVDAPVVSLAGDPHVRTPEGQWLDFYGEAGVYQLLGGNALEANAKFGYAVRDNHVIWHPKVMRPGTMIEEVGLKLAGEGVNIRLGVYGGGVVSITSPMQPVQFWTKSDDRSVAIGDYEVTWESCSTTQAMPWGTHERSRMLTVKGNGDVVQLFVAQSGGYHFVDVNAAPAAGSTGLLADAASSPAMLAQSLKSGAEHEYKLAATLLS